MTTVLNTDDIDPRDRADVMAAVVQEVSAPSHVLYGPQDAPIHAYFDTWEFGQVGLQRLQMSGFRLVRTPKQIRVSPSSLLALAVQREKSSRLSQDDFQYETSPGDMFIVDVDLPYQFDWRGGTVIALQVSLDRLGLPTETVRTALSRLRCSPIYPLVVNHITLMGESAELLHRDVATKELGAACLEMVRTLLISAATSGHEDGTALPADLLMAQIRNHVRRRLSDPDLNAPTIARAHNISVRHLYKLCARTGLSLEQWIITERLERVRADLTRPDTRHLSIAAIAHRNGFRHPAHLTRRFRAAYGSTPNSWRRTAQEGHVPERSDQPRLPVGADRTR
ncbi:helix-turn-helix domain-containing protein [Nocardia suismassiliense]|uniref:helix-turn-helix domain-containing protein n=1 Tax=Nocardia suismassiliense TaxID=2077092 RepID=UPI000D1FD828|nr:helix-turn-helix domain-containing protein [Nocardia suismassiliense]